MSEELKSVDIPPEPSPAVARRKRTAIMAIALSAALWPLFPFAGLANPPAAQQDAVNYAPPHEPVDPLNDPWLYYHALQDWWTGGLENKNWVPDLTKANPTDNGSGNWFGLRTALQNEGIQLGGQWISTFYGIADGGKEQQGAFDEQLKLFGRVDFEKLIGVPGLTFDISVRYRDGRDPNIYAGASSTFNPSAWQGGKGWRLMPFFLTWRSEKLLFDKEDFLILSGGWQDPYNFFGNDPLANQLINNAYTTKGLGSNGILYSSSYAAWGGYFKIRPVDWYYFQAGLYGAYPNATKKGNHGLDFQGYAPDLSMNGLYFLAETGVTPKIGPAQLPGKYAFGAVYWGVQNEGFFGQSYPSRYDFYWQMDQMLYRAPQPKPADATAPSGKSMAQPAASPAPLNAEGLYWFGWINYAPVANNAIPFYFQSGFSYKGLIPTREADQVIVGIAYGSFSYDQLQVQQSSGANQQTYEGEMEASYKIQVTKWAYFQPYIQYIFHPGGAGAVSNATVLGFQTGINF